MQIQESNAPFFYPFFRRKQEYMGTLSKMEKYILLKTTSQNRTNTSRPTSGIVESMSTWKRMVVSF